MSKLTKKQTMSNAVSVIRKTHKKYEETSEEKYLKKTKKELYDLYLKEKRAKNEVNYFILERGYLDEFKQYPNVATMDYDFSETELLAIQEQCRILKQLNTAYAELNTAYKIQIDNYRYLESIRLEIDVYTEPNYTTCTEAKCTSGADF